MRDRDQLSRPVHGEPSAPVIPAAAPPSEGSRYLWWLAASASVLPALGVRAALEAILGTARYEDGPWFLITLVVFLGPFLAISVRAIRNDARAQRSDPTVLRVNADLARVASELGGVFIEQPVDALNPYGDITVRLPEGDARVTQVMLSSESALTTSVVVRMKVAMPVRTHFEIDSTHANTPTEQAAAVDAALSGVPEATRRLARDIIQRWAAFVSVDGTTIVCVCRPWQAVGIGMTTTHVPERVADAVDVVRAVASLARALADLDASQRSAAALTT